MKQLWNRLWCHIDGHLYTNTGTIDFSGNRLFVCDRCGAEIWKGPR